MGKQAAAAAPAAAPRSPTPERAPTNEPVASGFNVSGGLLTGGFALPPGVRRQMEERFGDKFEDVRIHNDPAAAASALHIGARAYAAGRHIVFADGYYQPGAPTGFELLAHELQHVAESSAGARTATLGGMLPIVPDSPAHPGAAPTQSLAIRRQEMSSSELAAQESFDQIPANQSSSDASIFALPEGATLDQMQELMHSIDNIVPSQYATGMYLFRYSGAEFSLSEEGRVEVIAKSRRELKKAIGKSLDRSAGALGRFREQEKINDEFLVTSSAVKAWKWISTFGSFENPSESVYRTHDQSMVAVNRAQAALTAENQFSVALAHIADADHASQRTHLLVKAYVDGLIEGGESLVTVLTHTRDAAFLTAAAIGVIVTGGAALGLSSSVVGSGIGGLSVAKTVTVVTVGAPILARAGETGIRLANGEKIDWKRLAFDTGRDVLLAKIGGKLSASLGSKLAGNSGAQSLLREGLARLASGAAAHAESAAFSQALEQTYRAFNGQDVSAEQFMDGLSKQLASPEGWATVVLSAGVQTSAARRVSTAARSTESSSRSSSSPAEKPGSSNPSASKKSEQRVFGPPAPQTRASGAQTSQSSGTTSEGPGKSTLASTAKPEATPPPDSKPVSGPPAPNQATSTPPKSTEKASKSATNRPADVVSKPGKPPRKGMGYVTNETDRGGKFVARSEPEVQVRRSSSSGAPKAVPALSPADQRKVADARATIERLGRPTKKVKAATPEGDVVRSGSGRRVDASKATAKVLQKAKEIGHDLESNSSKDNNVPGSFNASHSEKKVAVTEPGKPIAVDKAMCSDCFAFMSKLARKEGPIVVHEPNVTWVFNRDGSRVGVNVSGSGVVLAPEGALGPAATAGPIDLPSGGQ